MLALPATQWPAHVWHPNGRTLPLQAPPGNARTPPVAEIRTGPLPADAGDEIDPNAE